LAVSGLALSGCGGSGGGNFESNPNLGIRTDDSEYGTMLFDERGQAIYLFDKETSDTAECYGDCAVAWPPVLTDGPPEAEAEVDAGLLGTTERDDGSLQVTYNGHPLYFYADEGPGEVLCHDVDDYGGTWLVVTPGGDAAPA
jgi:predicted lipoprotein with Yx(FWY)xxD motif